MAVTQSGRFSLNAADLTKWFTNALIFLAPALLAFLGVLVLQVKEQVPSLASIVVLYVLNVLTDLLRKYVSGPA